MNPRVDNQRSLWTGEYEHVAAWTTQHCNTVRDPGGRQRRGFEGTENRVHGCIAGRLRRRRYAALRIFCKGRPPESGRQRVSDPKDGRSSLFSLTRYAKGSLPGAFEALFQGNREALKGFTKEDAVQLTYLLTRLIANLDHLGE